VARRYVPNAENGSPSQARKGKDLNAERCRLYLITPPELADLEAFARDLEAALDAGDVAAVQLRLKSASDDEIRRAVARLRPVAQERDVAFLLNDRADLAAELGCDGVHIGEADVAYEKARAAVGPEAIVGVSCYDSRHLAVAAAEKGADYVAFGAFYPTATKEAKGHPTPEILEWWSEMTVVPCVAIGGITPGNCAPLVRAGADFLAVVSAVWTHAGGPAQAVRGFNRAIAEARGA
jgi:thiamine-phosphate pyrophosphorylase